MRRGVRLRSVAVPMNVLNRRWLFRVGVGLLGALLAIQLVPYGRDHGNPALRSEPRWDSPTSRALAKQACFDCHNNETEWPALLEPFTNPTAHGGTAADGLRRLPRGDATRQR